VTCSCLQHGISALVTTAHLLFDDLIAHNASHTHTHTHQDGLSIDRSATWSSSAEFQWRYHPMKLHCRLPTNGLYRLHTSAGSGIIVPRCIGMTRPHLPRTSERELDAQCRDRDHIPHFPVISCSILQLLVILNVNVSMCKYIASVIVINVWE